MTRFNEIKATLSKIGVVHVDPIEGGDYIAFVHFADMPKETAANRKVVRSLPFDVADKGLLFK
jgi:hypothetical protein